MTPGGSGSSLYPRLVYANGTYRTYLMAAVASAFDPQRTSACCCSALQAKLHRTVIALTLKPSSNRITRLGVVT